jgi:hypothetical protein
MPLTARAETARKTAKNPAKCPLRNGSSLKFDFLNKTHYTGYNTRRKKPVQVLPAPLLTICRGKSVLCFFGGT